MNAQSTRRWIVILAGVVAAAYLVALARRDGRPRSLPPAERRVEQLMALSDSFAWVAEQAGPAVVNIFARHRIAGRRSMPFEYFGRRFQYRERDRVYTSLGSGVIADDQGHVLTNHHVIEGADSVQVRLADGRTFAATFVGSDPSTDVGVLRLSARGLPRANLGDSDVVRVGDWVVAIGNPFGLSHTVTAGIISAKGRSEVGVAYYEDFLQTDAAINPGNSGGPLLDLRADVIGLNTAIASESGGYEGIGFAIPINLARGVMQSILKGGSFQRGFLGVTIQDLDRNLADGLGVDVQEGALVAQVMEGSPAEMAGIRAEDVIVRFDGRRIRDANALRTLVATTEPGREVKVVVARREESVTLDAVVGNPPAAWQETIPAAAEPWERLGFQVEELDAETARRLGIAGEAGVVVTGVLPGGPGGAAGLAEGDVILEANRREIAEMEDLARILNAAADESILLRVAGRQGSRFVVIQRDR